MATAIISQNLVQFLRDRIDHVPANIEPTQPIQFPDASRARDVHLGEIFPNHINPNEQQALAPQPWTDLIADPPVTFGKRYSLRRCTSTKVASKITRRWDSQQAKRDGLAIDQDDSLVALRGLCNIFLSHHEL